MDIAVCTHIYLEPFYQHFLRVHFNQDEPVFQFPKKHDLLRRLETFLTQPPESYKPPVKNEKLFYIAVPYMEHKNAMYYNYLSEAKQNLMVRRIIDYYQLIINDRFRELLRDKYTLKEIVYIIIEEYGFGCNAVDRIEKQLKRYRKKEKTRIYREKIRQINA